MKIRPTHPLLLIRAKKKSSFTSSESIHEDEREESETTMSHAVVFKCVGVNKGSNAHNVQRVLEEIAEKLRKEEAVTVATPNPTIHLLLPFKLP